MGYLDATGTAAKFDWLNGVAVDGAGNVYVSESNSHRIRKITAAGVVTTYVQGYALISQVGPNLIYTFYQPGRPRGLAVDGADNLYISDYGDTANGGIPLPGDSK